MRKTLACSILLVSAFLRAITSSAQTSASDSLFRTAGVEYLVSLYHTATGTSSNLYNGTQYEQIFPLFEKGTHQFFQSNEFTNGTLVYGGTEYTDAPLLYDVLKDELIVRHPEHSSWISLAKDKVDKFTLHSYNFTRLKKGNELKLPEGFYARLYSGGISLLAKYQKLKQEVITGSSVFSKVLPKTSYFIVKDGQVHLVKNRKGLLKLLGDKRGQLSQYIRKQKLNFRKEPEAAMVQVVSFYDQLSNER